jgi:ribosomal protein L40E/TATA-box binding protein (TBP) (component of TFIID and TFIIIB)
MAGNLLCPRCKASASVGSTCGSCNSYVNSISHYIPIADGSSEEYKLFDISVNGSSANCLFEPAPILKLQKAFPNARLLSEWQRENPAVFARARYPGGKGFVTPAEGLRIQDHDFTIAMFESGFLIAEGPRPVADTLRTISDYGEVLSDRGLYSKDLFAAFFFAIEGTAKIPLGMFKRIDLLKTAGYLDKASYQGSTNSFYVYNAKRARREGPVLVYNMQKMDVQILLQSNGEIRFATNGAEMNIIRALKLLQKSLQEERDVSTDALKEPQTTQERSKYVFCVACGARLPLDAVFCRSCGKEQPKV